MKVQFFSLSKPLSKHIPLLLASFFFALIYNSVCFGLDVGDVQSDGGLVPGSRIVRVTSLADEGDGSLRQALDSCGPCVIVFDIAGAIELQSDIRITKGRVTIAGETAPSPGVVLYGGALNIRTSDVVISHISVYPGSSSDPKIAESRHSISTFGSFSRKNTLHGIILRNVSAGWGVDENVGLQGLTDGVRIERALIAQALRYGGHPKGSHSMNLVLGNTVGRVVILGTVFAASDSRSPRFTTGNRVTFMNNLIVSPGAIASHLDTSSKVLNQGAIDMIGNVYVPGPFTSCRYPAINIDKHFLSASPSTSVFLNDNYVNNRFKRNCLRLQPSTLLGLAETQQTRISGWHQLPSSAVEDSILQFAGSHPLARNAIDERVIQKIKNGSLRVLDNEAEIGGFPIIRKVSKRSVIPRGLNKIKTDQDVQEIRKWLKKRYEKVTGLSSLP